MTSEGQTRARNPWMGEQAWHVRTRPTLVQWLYLAMCALASLACASLMLNLDQPGGDRRLGLACGAVAFLLYLLGIGYAIFLRTRMDCLSVGLTHVRLGTMAYRRKNAKLALRPWPRFGKAGVAVVLNDGEDILAVAACRRLVAPLGARPWRKGIAAELGAEDMQGYLHALGLPEGAFELGPMASGKSERLSRILPWLGALGVLAVFGPLVGPLLATSSGGRLVLVATTMSVIAVGLVLTASGRMPASNAISLSLSGLTDGRMMKGEELSQVFPSASSARGFWHSVNRVLGWQVAALVIAVGSFWPLFAIPSALGRWVDNPQCAARCQQEDAHFVGYGCTKSTGCTCTCEGTSGQRRHQVRFTVTGGDSALAQIVDWLVRTVATLLGLGLWIVGASIGLGWAFVKRRAHRAA